MKETSPTFSLAAIIYLSNLILARCAHTCRLPPPGLIRGTMSDGEGGCMGKRATSTCFRVTCTYVYLSPIHSIDQWHRFDEDLNGSSPSKRPAWPSRQTHQRKLGENRRDCPSHPPMTLRQLSQLQSQSQPQIVVVPSSSPN